MSDLLSYRPSIDHTPRRRSVSHISAENSSVVLEALASETARSILEALEEPTTVSDLAAMVGTSLQNVGYHLTKLLQAGLVAEARTWYSAKGRPMTVYGPTSERVEFRFVGDTAEGSERRA